jgi:hypothetical protein
MSVQPSFSAAAVVDALDPAWRGMVDRLFRPFDAGQWAVLAFTAWLSVIGQSGTIFDLQPPMRDPSRTYSRVVDFWQNHLTLLLGLASLTIFVAVGLTLALLWLRARAAFVFLDNVVTARAEVTRPWQETRSLGNSLFRWSLGFWAVSMVTLLLTLSPTLVAALAALKSRSWAGVAMTGFAVSLPLFLLWLLLVSYLRLFLHELVVPLMYRHRETASMAWRRFGALWRNRPGILLLYGLFRALLDMGIGSLLLTLGLLTCCCFFILLAVPYVYALALLPLFVFQRLYALEFLRRAGPGFDVWSQPAPVLPPPLPPACP